VKLRFYTACDTRPCRGCRVPRTHNPAAALAVRDAILRSLHNLTRFPAIGRPQNVEGVRKLVTPRYRYLVYYIIDEVAEEIVVLTIQHPARSRDYLDV
jgi:toxin ParE1/3/4